VAKVIEQIGRTFDLWDGTFVLEAQLLKGREGTVHNKKGI